MSTGAAATRGGGITIIAQSLKILILMSSVVVMSWLLPPSDVGLVAMAAIVVSFGELLRDFGLSTAALRSPNLTDQQASNLFWMNLLLGVVFAGLMAAISPLLAMFYDEPRVTVITPILALSLVVNGIQAQFQVQLARQQRFIALNATDVLAQAVGFAAAVIGALSGLGFWALVLQSLVMAFVLLFSRLIVARWTPSRPRRDGETSQLVRSGIEYSGTQVLSFVAGNVDSVTVGSRWGATDLGLYNRAYQLLTIPVARLLSPLVNVVVPVINRSRARGEDIYKHFLRIQSCIGLVTSFVFAVAVVLADPVLPAVLGEDWSGSVGIFRALAIGGAAQALSQVSFWVFLVEGQSRELLKYNLVTKSVTVIIVIFCSFVSVEMTAWGLSVSLLLSWPINIIWLSRTAGLPAWAFLSNGLRLLGAGTCAALAGLLFPIGNLVSSEWLGAGIEVAITVAVFFAVVSVSAAGRRDLFDTQRVLRRALKRG